MDRRSFLATGATVALLPLTEAPALAVVATSGSGDARLNQTFEDIFQERVRTSPELATYVVYVNRSRVDVFRGVFGRITRKIVTSKARATVAEHLDRLQLRLSGNAGGRP